MVTFAIIAALLVILSVLWWFKSVRISPAAAEAEYRALALEQINTYRLRLRELEHEKSFDELDEVEFTSSVNELKRQLLHDLKMQNKSDKSKHFSLFMPGMLFLLVFVAVFYFVNGESNKLAAWQETTRLLPELGERAMSGTGEPLSHKEMQQFALGLRTQLFEAGDEPMAWLLLGQVTASLNDLDSALLAFERAYRLDPEKLTTLLYYSQTLLMQPDAQSLHKAARMLSKVLSRQPQNVDALLMVGYIAEQRQDFAQAKLSWETVLNVLPQDDQRRAFVTGKLAQLGTPPASDSVVDAAPNKAAVAEGTETDAGVEGAQVNVHLRLDDAVVDKLPPGAILFVYAKAAKGMPMPAAVVKLEQFNLPMTVQLNDTNAMLPDYKLSNLEELVIYARVSKDGNIAVSAGELQGQTPVFSLKGTQEVSVVINQVL